jgi:RNA polymerase sigma-70 factor, ECF subfamily
MGQETAVKTDQELVRETLRDPNVYAALVERYQAALLRYILRLGCRSRDDAQDVLQESLLKAYLNLNDYDQDLKFSSWLYRIVHNETISHFRKTRVRPRAAETEDQLLFMENAASELDLNTEADRRLLAERLDAALAKVDDKYRDALVLRFMEEKSYEEISDILRLPMGSVATLISRGKLSLKKALGGKNI